MASLAEDVEDRAEESEFLLNIVVGQCAYLLLQGQRRFQLGPSKPRRLTKELQSILLAYYSVIHPNSSVSARWEELGDESNIMNPFARFHSHLVLDGRRIVPCAKASKAPNSIIQTEIDGLFCAGQVIDIITHNQNNVGVTCTFLHVKWFRHREDIDTSIWDP